MKFLLFVTSVALFSTAGLRAQVGATGTVNYTTGPSSFSGSSWEEFRNNSDETVNLQIRVTSNLGGSWMALEGDPGVPTANNIAPGATFWLATYSYGPGGFGSYSEERAIVGYSIVTVNSAPTIAWTSVPSSVANGQPYTVAAHGTDGDGNLAQVNVWKNGQPFAFADGGDGRNNDSGNTTSDGGPQTITFTAQAVDSDGATSPVISTSVTIAASANQAPTISWNGSPGRLASGQAYTISAHGRDGDGNLTQVNVWKNGQPYAFVGGGDGTDSDAANATNDIGPQNITFTAQAVDAAGATSAIITQMVTIDPPVNQAPSVTLLSPSTQTVTVGTTLTLSSRATDPDGNLTDHNLDIQRPAGDWNFQGGFATGEPYQGGPVGSAANSTRSASFTFIDVGTYYVRSAATDGSGWVQSETVAIAVVAANQPPTIAWTSMPGSVASGQSYTVSAHGRDDDGNLTAVSIWKNGAPFALAAGGDGSDGDSSNPSSDTGPQTITFTAQATDSSGASSAVITQSVTIAAPPIGRNTLTTGAGAGGSVSAGGTYDTGTVVTVTATPDATHDFAGWSGDAAGTANPLTLTLDRDKSVYASFALKLFSLTTSASSGGTVTAGGSYPAGTTVTIAATSDATHRFTGWVGDASGPASPVAITLDRAKSVQAVFTEKSAQTILFAPPGDRATASPPFALNATASSGLPVTYAVLSGPATLSNGNVQLTGPGPVTIQASQPGDDFYLPAAVTQTFNVSAPVTLKYRSPARTLIDSAKTHSGTPLVIQIP